MPVTKTAKRALRSSKKKGVVNAKTMKNLEIAVRKAKKSKKVTDIDQAISLADKAAKKRTIHKNKAARIKKTLAKLNTTTKNHKTASEKKRAAKK